MATADDRRHAERLIREYTRRKRVLELRKAKQGDSADPAVDVEIEELEAGIAALSPLTKPEPPAEAKQLVERQAGGLDMSMLFVQGTQQNARLTKIEEALGGIRDEQAMARVWRVNVTEQIEKLPDIQSMLQSEVGKRVIGQWTNRIFIFLIAVLVSAGGNFTAPALVRASVEVLGMAVVIVLTVRAVLWLRGR